MNTIQDRIRGSLVGGAIGDALGYPVEFMSRKSILRHFGEKGITRFELDKSGKALVSDDTQMTLFTANGLLNWWENENRLSGAPLSVFVEYAYLDWYYTQTGEVKVNASGAEHYSTWLYCLPELAHRRAPGTTCMSACESILNGNRPLNNSKGCGGIMRVAPLGLFQAAYFYKNGEGLMNMDRLAANGANIAKITHLHPLGYLPAALLTLVIARIVMLSSEEVTQSFIDIVKESLEVVMNFERNEDLEEITLKAIQMAESDSSEVDAIRLLGEGWTGEEAWAISLYCVVRHISSMKDAIMTAVNHDGDSDSTGSITGNIMGAIYGYEYIMEEQMFCSEDKNVVDTLELSDIILAIADDITLFPHVTEYSKTLKRDEAERWYQRYSMMIPYGL